MAGGYSKALLRPAGESQLLTAADIQVRSGASNRIAGHESADFISEDGPPAKKWRSENSLFQLTADLLRRGPRGGDHMASCVPSLKLLYTAGEVTLCNLPGTQARHSVCNNAETLQY